MAFLARAEFPICFALNSLETLTKSVNRHVTNVIFIFRNLPNQIPKYEGKFPQKCKDEYGKSSWFFIIAIYQDCDRMLASLLYNVSSNIAYIFCLLDISHLSSYPGIVLHFLTKSIDGKWSLKCPNQCFTGMCFQCFPWFWTEGIWEMFRYFSLLGNRGKISCGTHFHKMVTSDSLFKFLPDQKKLNYLIFSFIYYLFTFTLCCSFYFKCSLPFVTFQFLTLFVLTFVLTLNTNLRSNL